MRSPGLRPNSASASLRSRVLGRGASRSRHLGWPGKGIQGSQPQLRCRGAGPALGAPSATLASTVQPSQRGRWTHCAAGETEARAAATHPSGTADPAGPYHGCWPCPSRRPVCPAPLPELTVGAVAPAGALHAAAAVHAQEEVRGGEEAPPAHVALQVRVAAWSPRTARGPRGAGRPCQQQPHQAQPQAAAHRPAPRSPPALPPRGASAARPSRGGGGAPLPGQPARANREPGGRGLRHKGRVRGERAGPRARSRPVERRRQASGRGVGRAQRRGGGETGRGQGAGRGPLGKTLLPPRVFVLRGGEGGAWR